MRYLMTLLLALGAVPPLCVGQEIKRTSLPRNLGPFELGATVSSLRRMGFRPEREYSIGCPELVVRFDQAINDPVRFTPAFGARLLVDGESDNARVISIQAYVLNNESRRVFDDFISLYGRPYKVEEYTLPGEWPSVGYVDETTVIQIPIRPLSGDTVAISDITYRSICNNSREFEGDPVPEEELDH